MQNCTQYSAVFKWVQHTPMGWLKGLSEETLEEVRETLVTEVREVGRALHWVDNAIRLKGRKQQKWGGTK